MKTYYGMRDGLIEILGDFDDIDDAWEKDYAFQRQGAAPAVWIFDRKALEDFMCSAENALKGDRT